MPFRKTEAAVPPANTSPPPSDSDLLASMAARLAQAEAQLVTTRQEVREKEGRIRELERRLSAPTPPLPHSHGTPHDNHDDLLRKKCDILQKQIQEMEVTLQFAPNFLSSPSQYYFSFTFTIAGLSLRYIIYTPQLMLFFLSDIIAGISQ